MVIVAVRGGGGARGHVVRTSSGVKVATYYGHDSFERAVVCVRDRRSAGGAGG
jgi:hypothetical protein